MMINRSAAMALLLPLLLVLFLATSGQANADEPSTSHSKSYETSMGPSAATGGHRHREIKIGPCFPSRDSNALSDKGNAPSCIKRCTSKGYAGGRCDTVSGGLPGDCFCVTLDGRA
ncbi:hypothetical protein BDA96_04G053600 [Sorghum bicolor]|uniref:Knottin scorpion toxin-like domain-containing protein n=2 Tax=Sorghum bicolor TaxID=4558 RepID=A0A921R1U2_SORBI|nr:uncharacterized protein LOC110434512 [Sorghum bicolor]KAG0531799.1 hypothetical protein BDA96_04G053600 [Sorghum bicolor]KXG29516.1 hypothetical protein SORBI_3004G048500 [Sorghum bicolor]|eukprot:XP_021314331.1 uncharacterized protein LOC110434512 [Sorghum bicolor]